MRVIYLVRAAQLLVTLHALWMLYSVSAFCERTQHTMAACNDMIARIPMATPEEIKEHLRIKQQRAASNRPPATSNTSSPHPAAQSTPPTASIAQKAESSTVHFSSDEAKIRVKREERRELPGNGMSEAQRKAAAATVTTEKVEEKQDVKVEDTTPEPSHATTGSKQEQKEEQKPAHPEVKTEVKIEKKTEGEEKSKQLEAKTDVKKEEKNEKTVDTTPAPIEKSHQKEQQTGAKVEIPVAPQKEQHKDHVTKAADHAPSAATSGADEKKTKTVKKDLKAHHQEEHPVKVETPNKATPPKLAPAQQRFVLEHADAHLQEVRCLEVTSDAYFGRDDSPFAEHLQGLVFVGPLLVVVAVYLVCTAMRTKLSRPQDPNEFTVLLGCIFHCALWTVVGLSMCLIAYHWTDNWHTISSNTFSPSFPCAWMNLIFVAGFMTSASALETCVAKRLHDDIVFERSYRCYEVLDNSEASAATVRNHAAHYASRTNVY